MSLKTRFAAIKASRFSRQVAGMMAFTAMGQALYLLVGPVIGRLFTPEEIGLYGQLITIAVSTSMMTSLCYEMAIPACRSEKEAISITVGAFLLALTISCGLGAAFSLLAVRGQFGLAQFPIWAGALLAAILFSNAITQIAQNWQLRDQNAMIIGKAGITLNIVRGGSQIAFGLAWPVWAILVAGEILGRFANFIHVIKDRPNFLKSVHFQWSDVRVSLWRFREFPFVLTPALVIDAVAIVVQISVLGMLFGAAAMGQYFLMRRTLDLPVAFAVKSLADILYMRMAKDAREHPRQVRPFLVKSAVGLAAVGSIGFLPLVFFGPPLFKFVFGPNWEVAGTLAAVMVPAIILNLAVSPISRVFALTSRPLLRFTFGIVLNILSGAALWFSWQQKFSLIETVAAVSAALTVSYIAYFFAAVVASGHIRDDSHVGDERPLNN